jgi:molybdopterin converting factor small subunit
MTVTIHIPRPLRPECNGAAELRVPAASVRNALARLQQEHPQLYRSVCDETGAVRRHVNLFINNDHIRDRDGLETTLYDGDAVHILPAVSGG